MRRVLSVLTLLFLLSGSSLFAEIGGITMPPGGVNGSMQFNRRGLFGGTTDFTYSTGTKILAVPFISGNGSLITGLSVSSAGLASASVVAASTNSLAVQIGTTGADLASFHSAVSGSTAALWSTVGSTWTALKATGTALTSLTGAVQTATASLTTRLGNIDTSTGALTVRLNNLDSSTTSLTSLLGNVATATTTLSNSTASLVIRVNNIDSSTAALTVRLGNLDSSTSTLSTAINSTGAALTNLTGAVQTSTTALTTRLNNLDSSTAALTVRLGNLDTSTAALNVRLSNLDSSTATIMTRLNFLDTSTTTLSNSTATLLSLLKTTAAATSSGFSTVASATASLSVRSDNLDISTAALTIRLNNLDSSTAAITAQLGGGTVAPGSTNYIQNGPNLQAGASFYIQAATVNTLVVTSTASFGRMAIINSSQTVNVSSFTSNNISTTVGSGATDWNNPQNAQVFDLVYASCTMANGTNSYELRFTSFNFNIPLGSTVTRVTVTVCRFADAGAATVADTNVFLLKNGNTWGVNIANGGSWGSSLSTITYQTFNSIVNRLQPEDVNDPSFGVSFQIRGTGGGNKTAYLDGLRVGISYRTPVWNIGQSSINATLNFSTSSDLETRPVVLIGSSVTMKIPLRPDAGIAGMTTVGSTLPASSLLDLVGGSLTVRGTGAGIQVGNFGIFNSTATGINLTGYTIQAGTATVAANSTLTITPTACTSIQFPFVNQTDGNATIGIEINSWTPGGTSFDVKNLDAIALHPLNWLVFCK